MHVSGILVRLRPEAWTEGCERLAAVPGVEVHHEEAASGRVIVVVESEGLEGQRAALQAIRDVPGVVLAEPVYHYAPPSGTPDATGRDEEDPS